LKLKHIQQNYNINVFKIRRKFLSSVSSCKEVNELCRKFKLRKTQFIVRQIFIEVIFFSFFQCVSEATTSSNFSQRHPLQKCTCMRQIVFLCLDKGACRHIFQSMKQLCSGINRHLALII
jgi:hypothetical protein